MDAILAISLALVGITICTAIHYETILRLDTHLRSRHGLLRRHVPTAVAIVTCAHLVEIAIYAVLIWFATVFLELGSFSQDGVHGAQQYFALAAESYTSFGYGDIIPTGWLRVIVGFAPINGLMLLAWSGAFLYSAIHQRLSP